MSRISKTFFNNSRSTPDAVAIYCEGVTITYGQLADLVSRWRNGMVEQGVKRGDHIGVLLPNSIEFVALMLVAADIGAVLVPLNTSLPIAAIHRAFVASDVKHIISVADTLAAMHDSTENDFTVFNGLWLSLDKQVSGCEFLNDLVSDVYSQKGPLQETAEDDPFILTMTSGSTGDPKPIVLTQRTKFNRAMAAVALYDITATDRILAATPLYHSLAERLVLLPLLVGGSSVLMTRFSPSEWLRCVREHEVTFTIAVSSQLKQIAERLTDEVEKTIHSLRCVVSSSAQLNTQIKAELLAKLHCEFHECYGTSEIAIASNLDGTADKNKLQSVGVAAPGVEIKILCQDGQIAAAGDDGEIICKTTMLFGGYYKRPELTAEAMWCGEYFRTGDLGRLDEDGYLYYLGRTKELIITGGINVYPQDIEVVLSQLPDVAECAVFALPDDALGEVVAAALVPRIPGVINLRTIRHFCAENLADFQQPRKYFILEELPKSGMGKVLKRMLPGVCGV